MNKSLQNLFYPKSLLIAGVSSKKGSIGYELTSSILKNGFKGEIYLVNPSSEEILGIKCYKNASAVPGSPDMAVILVPKHLAEQVIDECIAIGIMSFILITAGFRETGREGEKAEKRIAEKIKSAGARLVGPNCMGVINTLDEVKLNATFVAEYPEAGKSAFLSQSGALGAAVLNSLRETGIKFAHFISVGNKADISENDLIGFWSEDKNISVIALYLESFTDGKNFLEAVGNQVNRKPVIILKAGKTESGKKAASSHTGALGSSDRSVDAVVNQFGLIRVDNLNDLFNTAKGFEFFPPPKGNKVAVVTNAGGPAILAVDMIENCGLHLSSLSDITRDQLKNFVHPEGSINNPVDLLPGGTAETYKSVVEILIQDDQVDSVLVIFVEPVMVKPLAVAEAVNSVNTDKPVFTVAMPLPEFWGEYKKKYPSSRPVFRNPEDPAVIIKNMLGFHQYKINQNRLKVKKVAKKGIITSQQGFLSQTEVLGIAEMYSIPVVKNMQASYDHLHNIKDGFPFVLKAGGKNIIHKTELGGVQLNITSQAELISAADKMMLKFKNSGTECEYFILQPYIKTRYELLAGGFTDPDFGAMVMFGSGGKYVEFYKDVAVKSAMLSETDLDDIINSTVMGKLLDGVRGEEKADIPAVKKILSSVGQMMLDFDEIGEIDLNPLILSEENKLYAVDIRIKLK